MTRSVIDGTISLFARNCFLNDLLLSKTCIHPLLYMYVYRELQSLVYCLQNCSTISCLFSSIKLFRTSNVKGDSDLIFRHLSNVWYACSTILLEKSVFIIEMSFSGIPSFIPRLWNVLSVAIGLLRNKISVSFKTASEPVWKKEGD